MTLRCRETPRCATIRPTAKSCASPRRAYARGGCCAVSLSGRCSIQVWDAHSGTPIADAALDCASPAGAPVACAALSPDSGWIVALARARKLCLVALELSADTKEHVAEVCLAAAAQGLRV